MKTKVLAILPGIMPSTQMDVILPLLALERSQFIQLRVVLENYPFSISFDARDSSPPDLVIFCRNSESRYRHILEKVQKGSIPYIYDLDDNLLDIPLETADGAYYRSPEQAHMIERYLRGASLVRVYSPMMLERVHGLGARSALVKPPINWQAFTASPHQSAAGGSPQVKIVYATSRRQDGLAALFIPALRRILQTYEGKVSLHFWGYLPHEFRQRRSNIRFHEFTQNYPRFIRQFSTQGYEIGLAPLLDDVFHRSKTNNKFREYGACGIAGIYSNTPVYANCVENGVTGLLIPNQPDDWYKAITKLIDNPELRTRIGHAARQKIEREYPPGDFEEIWLRQIESALSEGLLQSPDCERSTQPLWQVPAQDSTSTGRLWLKKFKRAARTSHTLNQLLGNSRLHLSNLWWLFKINKLKRL